MPPAAKNVPANPAGTFDSLSPPEIRPALLRRGCRRVALVAEADAPALQVVRRHFHDHPVADAGADAEFAHLPGGVSQHLVFVVELHPEIAVGENLGHGTV